MKVYVTQGHEQGIGLEVFLKSCLMLRPAELSQLELLAYSATVAHTLKTLKLPYSMGEQHLELAGVKIATRWLQDVEHSQSFTALKTGMELAGQQGILYTLPTSKDQFPEFAGHTEFFRHYYQSPELGMFFSGPDLQVLLITDHWPLARLSKNLTEEIIYKRLRTAIKTLQQWRWPVAQVLVSGLNPHAGEGGLIGKEDEKIKSAIKRLSPRYKFQITGPIPGDTMLLGKGSPEDLLVYMFHDQGLGVFKGLNGFVGSNITLGLPFPRFSPDHGTSFSLFGKNQADYRGCAFSLKQAIHLLKRVTHAKNSGHQSKSS
jgi:4-hydroxythreonine-4-phosphate dehydrogenase